MTGKTLTYYNLQIESKEGDHLSIGRQSLNLCIEEGRSDNGFFGHLADISADEGLTRDDVTELIAKMAESEAERYLKAFEVVTDSVKGFERLTGDASYEKNRYYSLLQLAGTLRDL